MLLDLLWNFHSPLPPCRAASLAFCWLVRLRPQQQFKKRVMATATPSGAGAGAGAGSAGHADLGVDTASGLAAAPSKPLFPDSGSVLVRNARVWVWDATGTTRDAMLDCAYHFEDWLWVRDGVVQVSASTQRWLRSLQHSHRCQATGKGAVPDDTLRAADACKCPVVDAAGRIVLPGLHDSHCHVFGTGRFAAMCDVSGATSVAELQAKLRAFAEANPSKKWIVGRGWEQDKLGRCVR